MRISETRIPRAIASEATRESHKAETILRRYRTVNRWRNAKRRSQIETPKLDSSNIEELHQQVADSKDAAIHFNCPETIFKRQARTKPAEKLEQHQAQAKSTKQLAAGKLRQTAMKSRSREAQTRIENELEEAQENEHYAIFATLTCAQEHYKKFTENKGNWQNYCKQI